MSPRWRHSCNRWATSAERASSVEDLLRDLAPQVLGALVRRSGDFDAAEDAVQEALLAAALHWPRDGVPAKPRIKASGVPFRMPTRKQLPARLRSVLHVLYLIFNEGYASSTGRELHRTDLSDEAIRLSRMIQRMLPDDAEVAGLLALMLLIDARRPARTDASGELVTLVGQDRTKWDRALIAEGVALINRAIGRGVVG